MIASLAAVAVVTTAASGVTTTVAGRIVSVAAAAVSVAAALASWRWVVRPLRTAWHELVTLLRQIRDASKGIERLSREMHELAGAVVQMAVRMVEAQQAQQRQIEENRDRLSATVELVIDLTADVRRLERAHTRRGHTKDD